MSFFILNYTSPLELSKEGFNGLEFVIDKVGYAFQREKPSKICRRPMGTRLFLTWYSSKDCGQDACSGLVQVQRLVLEFRAVSDHS